MRGRPGDAERDAAFERDAAPVRRALAEAGIDTACFGRFIQSSRTGSLPRSRMDNESAVPVLLEWLTRVRSEEVKAVIVRHLHAGAARGVAAGPLIAQFASAQNMTYKRLVGDMLAFVLEPGQDGELVALAADRRHGAARRSLVGMLWRVRNAAADEALAAALTDPDVASQAMSAVCRRYSPAEARKILQSLAGHPQVGGAARGHLGVMDGTMKRQ